MTLVRCHRGIRPALLCGHLLYGVPGERIYLDVREADCGALIDWMRARS